MKINEFIYSPTGIKYPKKITCPEFTCKYYALTDYSIDAFINNYLFASHPIELNDISDSHWQLFKYRNKPNQDVYTNFKQSQLFNIDNNGEKLKFQIWRQETTKFGITSLSELDKSDLMWAHYTKENGFMVKFKTAKLLQCIEQENKPEVMQFFPMNYVERLNQIIVNPTIAGIQKAIYYMLNAKGVDWNYENEWRLFIVQNNMTPPLNHYLYKKDKNQFAGDNRKRQIKYIPEKCIDKIVWGNNFVTSIERSRKILKTGWVVFKLIRGNKKVFKLLEHIAEKYSDKFYISFLKKEKNNTGQVSLVRCNRRFEIKTKYRNILIKETDECC
jgi:hypothetical protein